ncbi:MAG: restriction endonuclease [Chloroflexota bacterium]
MAKRATLRDLLNAGLLRAGEALECEPRQGEVYKATLGEDESISYEGISFDSPSIWASYVAQNERNGWRDVRARGRRLAEFRAQLGNAVTIRQRPRASRRVGEPAPGAATPPTMDKPTAQKPEAPLKLPPPPVTQQADIKDGLLKRLQSLTAAQFEHFVARFLEAKGLANARVTGRTGDGGVDGECEQPFVKLKVAFQAKRWATGNNVGIEPIQRLIGSMSSRFDRGVFITTSSFTPAARGWVEETRSPITLVDGNELVSGMVEMGLGMKTIPVVESQIDEDFFNALGS